ncbi:MAG TPA: ADOP family duplicated permease [Vicinamibacterales bacterium]|nr:ADOP family duplicated permease [Vicinamibacterales bacterium]
MSASTPPPRVADRLLQLVLRDPEWRDGVVGDLHEEFATHCQRLGEGRARRWYWWQSLAIATRVSIGRLVPGHTTRRRWRQPEPESTSRWAWLRDVHHAARALTARPALSAVIVVTLALALASNATVFTLADALYLRPFRFAGVDRLAIIASSAEQDPLADKSSVAPADFLEWKDSVTTMRELAAADFWDPNLSQTGEPEQLAGFRVSPEFFRLIGTQPLYGRTFLDAEATPGQDRRVVLAHGLWVRRFGGDPSIVGRLIRLNGEPHEVVGVLRPGPSIPYGAEVYAPLALTDAQRVQRDRGFLLVLGRLGDGQSLIAARDEMRAIVERQRQRYPDTHAKREISVVTMTRGLSDQGAGPFLAIWQAAALLLLLVACANIANLLLARGTERNHEFAMRLALGASRWRLVLQVIVEGAWLAVLAIAISLPLAALGVAGMRRGLPPAVLRWVSGHEFLRLDMASLATTAALGALATVVFSIAPALNASRAVLADALRQGGRTLIGGRGRRWLGTSLAAVQVALAVTLVVASGLILSAVDHAVNGALGFDKSHVMTATMQLPDRVYATPESRRQFVDRVLDRLRGMPAVNALAAVSFLPYDGASTSRPIYPEGQQLSTAEVRRADLQRATADYFDVMHIPVLEGRALSDADRHDTLRVAVVSRSFADRYWPGDAAVGRRFRIDSEGPWIEVVGVVGDIVHDWFMNQRRPTVYEPVQQDPSLSLSFALRTNGDPLSLAGELRRAIGAADPDLPIIELRTMDKVVANKVGGIDYLAKALAVMGLIALGLALTGVYSLLAYLAARRTQEFGVRLALGASRRQVMALTLRQAVQITIAGLALGGVLSVVLNRVMVSALYGLVSLQGWLIAGLVVVIGLTALAAGYLPARRAADLDPTEALRTN